MLDLATKGVEGHMAGTIVYSLKIPDTPASVVVKKFSSNAFRVAIQSAKKSLSFMHHVYGDYKTAKDVADLTFDQIQQVSRRNPAMAARAREIWE